MSYIDKLQKAMKTVKKQTNIFTTFVADDDFFIVEKLIEYKFFLEENSDYSAIQGGHVSFWQEEGRHLLYVSHQYAMKKEYKIDQENNKERAEYYFHNYFNVFYALTRKDLIIHYFETILPALHQVLDCELYIDLIEVSQACFLVFAGKIKIDKSIAMYREFIPDSVAHAEMVRISQLVAENSLTAWKAEFSTLLSKKINLSTLELSELLDIAMIGVQEFQDNKNAGDRKNLRRIEKGIEMDHIKEQWQDINKFINAKITSF
ncbi:hypothetical protein A9Q74_14130 [Colwellia sp. 39_35_sub15_T18]|nr:hypothetical protein A9Q74_14130 [Colwellia sp. 39_35_sub15_T18]